MSKKKVASRSAMTLKDFHGGSIPSDLPLPSAPGMTVDRSAYERQGSGTWMSPTLGRGYGNDRSGYHRHGSSNGVRTFEDKASYFPNPANIGRNYDEDERKPVDGRPRSSHSPDRFDDHAYEERRGGYPTDRYTIEDHGNFSSTPSFSEPRNSGTSDRFPPSQVTGSGFESDIYVHDEFGLIPVGPPPSRVSPHELQSRQQPTSYQKELVQTRAEQPSYIQVQQLPSISPYSLHQQIATSPPSSWKNSSSQQSQISSSAPVAPPEISANVWTPRRDGDVNRTLTPEPPSEIPGSFPWRPQGTVGRVSETRSVDKRSLGRRQTDLSRTVGTNERRSQFSAEHIRESDMKTPREGVSDVRRGEYSDRAGLADEQAVGHGDYGVEMDHRSYVEEPLWSSSGGFSETDIDVERFGHSVSARGGSVDLGLTSSESLRGHTTDSKGGSSVDGLRSDLFDQNRAGYKDANRIASGSSGVGPTPNSGRSFQLETARSAFSELPCNDAGGSFSSSDGGHVLFSGNSRTPLGTETVRNPFGSNPLHPSEGCEIPVARVDHRSDYVSDGNNAVSGGDLKRSWSPLSLERAGAELSDKVRNPAPEGWRTGFPSASFESSFSAESGEHTEIQERPKLKLLPRSKPLEKIETSNFESEDVVGRYEEGSNIGFSHSDDKKLPESLSVETVPKRPDVKELGGTNDENEDDSSRRVGRPKLNLKPRSRPTEAESGEGSQKVRQLVFGGARPRELVLKERGVDDLLNGTQDVPSPVTASSLSSTISGVKLADTLRVERPDSRADEKQDSRRYEWQDRSFERQGGHRTDRQESSSGPEKGDFEDSQWDQERADVRRKREFDRQEIRRDADSRRDISKKDSWRRPVESPPTIVSRNSSSTVSSLVDLSPRAPGRFGYSPTASAVELAQAFSRSSSIGSTMTSASRGATTSLRSPLSPIPKSFVQGSGNGIASSYASRDAPFSRLAEASTPTPFLLSGTEIPLQGGGFGLEGHTNFYGSAKLGVHRSADLNRAPSSGRADLVLGQYNEENDDFPGKRGLPLRQKEGYYD